MKKLFHLKNNFFLLYAPRYIKFKPTELQRTDSGILDFIPENVRGFVTSKFREDEIHEICNGDQRLWVKILNKSCKLPVEIKKGCFLGFFVAEPEHLKFQYETTTQITKAKKKKQTKKSRKKKQLGGFLNRYGFAYAGRDTVNQAAEVTPGVIKNAGNEINNIAEEKINQIITQGGKEAERVLPKILRGVIEDVCQTPFRLLQNFGKQQLNKLKRKILK